MAKLRIGVGVIIACACVVCFLALSGEPKGDVNCTVRNKTKHYITVTAKLATPGRSASAHGVALPNGSCDVGFSLRPGDLPAEFTVSDGRGKLIGRFHVADYDGGEFTVTIP